jgi:chromosome partitioning protein
VEIRYGKRQFAKLLGITARQLMAADKQPELAPLGGGPDSYEVSHLSAYRRTLDRRPHRLPLSRQLFLNFKGGTGKTSLSTSYAYRLAERGHRVLMVDLDSQGHATKCLGKEGGSFKTTLYDALVKKKPISGVTIATGMPGLDLVPSNLTMSTVDLALMPLAGREFRLRKALEDVNGKYDFVVMDAPPSFGLLNLNALMAAHDLVVPVLADFLSYDGLRLLFETIQGLEEDLSHQLENLFIVVNAFNQTFKIAREALEALREHYSDYLLPTVVRQCTKFAQSSSEGTPIFAFDPDSKGASDLEDMLNQVMKRIGATRAAAAGA